MSKASWQLIYHQIYLKHHPEITEIPDGYCIHHIDGDHWNNDPNNLQLMTVQDHNRLHMTGNTYWQGRKHKDESKIAIGNANRGENNGMYGKKEDPQHAKERGKKITQAKIKPVPDDIMKQMIQDVKDGIARRKFADKYKELTYSNWNRIRENLLEQGIEITKQKRKRKPHSEESKQKMSERAKGREFTNEHKQKLSEAHKGKIPWNKNINK